MKHIRPRMPAVAAMLMLASMVAGCIVCDQITTITVNPDGSADVVVAQSNVHSSLAGVDGREEMRRFVQEFNDQQGADHLRVIEAGGQVQQSHWIRSEAPYANMIQYKLPTAAVLEKAFTIKGDAGESIVTARFTRDGTRRKLSFLVTLSAEQVADATIEQTIQQLRASQANGLSEMRIAVNGGNIQDARCFTIADDKQSALLDTRTILELLRNQREIEAFVEWEVSAK